MMEVRTCRRLPGTRRPGLTVLWNFKSLRLQVCRCSNFLRSAPPALRLCEPNMNSEIRTEGAPYGGHLVGNAHEAAPSREGGRTRSAGSRFRAYQGEFGRQSATCLATFTASCGESARAIEPGCARAVRASDSTPAASNRSAAIA
jgi:hypothetical protein